MLLALVFGLISYIFANAVMARINSVAEDREMSFSEAVATGFRYLLRTWWFFILLILPVFLVGMVMAILVRWPPHPDRWEQSAGAPTNDTNLIPPPHQSRQV